MTAESNEERREKLIVRLHDSHELAERCLSDVTPQVAWRGSEWSVGDLLGHLSESYYQNVARRFLSEESPELPGFDAEWGWKRGVDKALNGIEDALSIARALTAEQMTRTGQMGSDPLTALDALELCAAHFEEHISQLKNEVRPREGLPPV